MMPLEQQVSARLRGPPYPGRPVSAAAAPMPLAEAEEFAMIDAITPRNPTEIFVSPRELFSLLDEIVEIALAALPDRDCAFVQLAMPGTTRLPPGLLREEVLLLPSVERCYRDAVRRGAKPLALSQDLRRFPTEDSYNRLTCRWTATPTGEEAAAKLKARLAALSFVVDDQGSPADA